MSIIRLAMISTTQENK
ncbi:hypothetical protein [Phytobacter sp. AG2a]